MDAAEQLFQEIETRVRRELPPPAEELAADMAAVGSVLEHESSEYRPPDATGRPGGYIRLNPELPTVVVPDVHARVDLVLHCLSSRFPEHGIDAAVIDALVSGRAQLLFLGDFVHAESRARFRWLEALREFEGDFATHRAMDAEMRESLTVLQLFSLLKQAFPDRVHGLKGNHENIANEEGRGNHPFGKFASEGAMVARYMKRFYSGAAFDELYRFEHSLPLVAVGARFLVSHAEPRTVYTENELRSYHDRPELVEGLTWTDNDAAESGSVAGMLKQFFSDLPARETIYLGGHRPVSGLYSLRAGGRYVQFHNPDRMIVALPPNDRPFDPEQDICEIGNRDGQDD